MSNVKIIAGPCSVNESNVKELYDIANLNTAGYNFIYGVRVVGLKSRTELQHSREYMGIDFDVYHKMYVSLIEGDRGNTDSQELIYPSLEIAKNLHAKHPQLMIASEIVDPYLQIPYFAAYLGDRFIPWNPAVNALGWPMAIFGEYAKKYNLTVGVKNPKNLGISIVDSEIHKKSAPLEAVWKGIATYTGLQDNPERVIMIQRGIDDPSRDNYRNFPIHECAMRVKSDTNYQMFFDPSHVCGPKLQDKIIDQTVEAMKIKLKDGRFLYDGILLEVGTSTTDTKQHITIDDLSILIDKLSAFREFSHDR